MSQPLFFTPAGPQNGEGPVIISCPYPGETAGDFVAEARFNGDRSLILSTSHAVRQTAIANCRAALIAAGIDLDAFPVIETNKVLADYRVL